MKGGVDGDPLEGLARLEKVSLCLTISRSLTKNNLFPSTNLKCIGSLPHPLLDPTRGDKPFSRS